MFHLLPGSWCSDREAPRRRRLPVALLAWAFIILNVVDLFLTFGVLRDGGDELNAVIAPMMKVGTLQFASYKVVASAFFAWLLCRLRQRPILTILVVGMLGVCGFNAAGLILW